MELLLGINGAMHVKYLAHADCKITSSLNKDSIMLTVRRKRVKQRVILCDTIKTDVFEIKSTFLHKWAADTSALRYSCERVCTAVVPTSLLCAVVDKWDCPLVFCFKAS